MKVSESFGNALTKRPIGGLLGLLLEFMVDRKGLENLLAHSMDFPGVTFGLAQPHS